MQKYSFFIIIALILTSCESTGPSAPIIFHHKKNQKSDDISTHSQSNTEAINIKRQSVSEIVTPRKNSDDQYIIPTQPPQNSGSRIIYHETQIGENIKNIAEKYHSSIQDIASLNHLSPPYELDEFEVLKIRIKQTEPTETLTDNKKANLQFDPFYRAYQSKNNSFIKPLVNGNIITKFNASTPYGPNKGVTISAKSGTEILAVSDGKIIYADYDAIFGNLILMKVEKQNKIISYAHLRNITVKKGASVTQGSIIGYVGNSGRAETPQLHFGIREGTDTKNPENFIDF